MTSEQHTLGDPLSTFGIPISLHKTIQRDKFGSPVLDNSGNQVMRCGFRIGGGIDQNPLHCPHGYPDKGIYVTFVEERGAAAMAGLQAHDKILQVNGLDFTMITHDKACKIIKKEPALQIIVYRKTIDDNLYGEDSKILPHPVGYQAYDINNQDNVGYHHSAPNTSFASPTKY